MKCVSVMQICLEIQKNNYKKMSNHLLKHFIHINFITNPKVIITSSYSFSLGADSSSAAIAFVWAIVEEIRISRIRLLLTAEEWWYRAYLNCAFWFSSIISLGVIGGSWKYRNTGIYKKITKLKRVFIFYVHISNFNSCLPYSGVAKFLFHVVNS